MNTKALLFKNMKRILYHYFPLFLFVVTVLMPLAVVAQPSTVLAADNLNQYITSRFVDSNGREIVGIRVPGCPPPTGTMQAATPQAQLSGTAVLLPDVPAFGWAYGCSATSAAMMFGYYDNVGYGNIYAGLTNNGVCPCPTNSSVWGSTTYDSTTCIECPLSATHLGVDGRTTRGSVDDYWIDYLNPGPDPYIVNGWAEHTSDCLADFMGTSQSKYSPSNPDGSTTFFFAQDGSPYYDPTPTVQYPSMRDGCHGLKLFAESRGYTVTANFNQYIYGQTPGNPNIGFTFDNYKAEINAGRPVLIQLNGHTVIGYGYDAASNTIYIHDTWDYSTHTMTWGGAYSGMQQYAVTVLRLQPIIASTITVNQPNGGENWQAGSTQTITWTSADISNNVTISISRDDGSTWSNIITNTPNDGSHNWVVTGPATNQARLRIFNLSNNSTGSSDRDFTIGAQPFPILASPANSSTVSSTSVTYSWNSVSGALCYSIYVSSTSNFSSIKFNKVTTGTIITDTGYPDDGTKYYWVVYAWNGASWSPASAVWSFTNIFQPPTLVSPANSSNISGTLVTYSWNSVPGATCYSIYVSSTPNFNSIKFNQVTSATSITDSGYPNNGTNYYWVIYAWNGSSWSPPSTVWSFTDGSISSSPILVSPANSSNISGTLVTYSWNSVPGATYYSIYVSSTPNFNSIKFNQVTSATSITDSGYPNNGTNYYWVIYAWNGSSWSPPSTVWSFTDGSISSAPILVSPANSSTVYGTSVTYSWNSVPGATCYSIYVSSTPNFNSIKFNQVTGATSITDSGYPSNGTNYYWVVYAWNGSSWSPPSTVWSFTNISQPPTLVSPANNSTVSGASVTYSWNAVPGAICYTVYVSSSSNFSSIRSNKLTTGLSVTDAGYLNDGTRYYWVVYAWNGTSWSPPSAVWSFTNP